MAIDKTKPPIEARGIRSQFGANVIHEDLNFRVNRGEIVGLVGGSGACLLYTSPSPRDKRQSRMPSSA